MQATNRSRSGHVVTDRFEQAARLVVIGLLLAIVAVVLHGDQIGIAVQRYGPVDSASGQPLVQVTFSDVVEAKTLPAYFQIEPKVDGTFAVNGPQFTFRPTVPLTPAATYTITLRAGLPATNGQTLKQPLRWQFKVRQPQIVYLSGSSDPPNLYLTDAAGSTPRRLTNNPCGVAAYDVAPDGSRIVYAETLEQESSRLLLVELASSTSSTLYECKLALCTNSAWRPDGGAVVFDYVDLSTGQIGQAPRLWLYDLVAGAAHPLFKDAQIVSHRARWSSDGKWIASGNYRRNEVLLYNTIFGTITAVPLPTEQFGEFSPNCQWITFPRLVLLPDKTSVTQVTLIDLSGGVEPFPLRSLLPQGDPGNDIESAWLPDSTGFITARRPPFTQITGQGSRLFRINLETGDSEPIPVKSPDDNTRQAAIRVSPAGDAVMYRKVVPGQPATDVELWLTILATGKSRRLVPAASDPRWIP